VRLPAVRRVWASLLAVPLLSGCLTAEYTSWHTLQEPAPEAGLLRPGQASLELCLATLGAPLYVREHVGGMMLAWGWADERRWGLTLSLPADVHNASFTYRNSDEGLEGLVMIFDEGGELTIVRRGRLAEVLMSAQRRAIAVED
jgi:hypothetical protein